jgi:hypothetical protein
MFWFLLLLVVATLLVHAESNTNACISIVEKSQSKLCTSAFFTAGCSCNPAMDVLYGSGFNANSMIQCKKAPMDCSPFQGKTYINGTCPMSDIALDAARLGIGKVFAVNIVNGLNSPCFPLNITGEFLSSVFSQGISVTVSYGFGKYIGYDHVLDYVALASSGVNRGFYHLKPKYVSFRVDADHLFLIGANDWNAFDDKVLWKNIPFDQNLPFAPCSSIPIELKVSDTSDFSKKLSGLEYIPKLVYTAFTHFDKWGIRNTCMYHERYCTGSNKQFESFDECMRFQGALPVISPVCGTGGMMGGNSSLCRSKHGYMSQFHPSNHCFHLGYGHLPDGEGKFKCNDNVECAEPDIIAEPLPMSFLKAGKAVKKYAKESNKIYGVITDPNAWLFSSVC